MPMIAAGGLEIYYEERGTGAPLVCIAGLGAAHDAWAPVRGPLAEKFRVIVFDNRGVGRTRAPSAPFDIDCLADDTCALLDALAVPAACLAGHSMGCAIALAAARRHPARVARLILCNPCVRLRARSEFVFRTNAHLWRAGLSAGRIFPVIMPWLFSEAWLADQSRAQALMDAVAALPAAQTAADFERQLAAMVAFDAREWLDQIRTPALLMAGAEDLLTPPEDARALAERLPRAQLAVLPAAHMSLAEAPDRCVKLMTEFLSS
ncbi:MAG: alpha/beta fold hydrolase [Syntrophomonadaceae bacterium]|nr:alpha/beta fold hydrolase [Syntrophomonadaceae bacterium]